MIARGIPPAARAAAHATLGLGLWLVLAAPASGQQIADTTYDTRVARPAYAHDGPRLLFDEAHHEFHRLDGRYRPFADLARHDGYRVRANAAPFDSAALAGAELVVIANALGDERLDSPGASNPAFTSAECGAVLEWVRRGGALLLIADHAPMGDAARGLGQALGVDLRGAYTSDPGRAEGGNATLLHFRAGRGLNDSHPIIAGRDAGEHVRHVLTFTGQSLAGPPGAVPLLSLSERAEDLMVGPVPAGGRAPSDRRRRAAGRVQGLAFTIGSGRVVVLGEAAMLSAQVAGRKRVPMGMNVPGNDDRQFALNVLHWLTRLD